MRRVTPAGELVLPSGAPRIQWLTARQKGIAATDIPRILGISQWGNAIDVFLDKRAPAVIDSAPSEAAEWGHLLEDPVARKWAATRGAKVRRIGLLRHHTQTHHLASCDRLIVGQDAVLEVKTKSAFASDAWRDGPPDHVLAQVQWQLHVTGLPRAHVAALVGGQRLKSFLVPRDQDVIDYLAAEADRVWAAVLDGQPPHVDPEHLTAASLNRLHPERAGLVDVPEDQARPLLDAYRAASSRERAAAAEKDQARLALVELLGRGEAATVAGRVAYTYSAQTRRRVDPDRLLGLVPEAAALVETKTTRTFRLTKEAS